MTNETGEQVVGRVAALWRYPVKSMAGESLASVDFAWHGVVGDRRWAMVRRGAERTGFPWLTSRRHDRLAHYVPSLDDPSSPERSTITVRTPTGDSLPITDERLAAELGEDLYALKHDIGIFDTLPLSVLSVQSVAAISERVGEALPIERFRPNLVVEGLGEDPFPEDAWVGAHLRIGAARVAVNKRDQRCAVVNLDPAGTTRNPQILKTIAQERESRLGVYGSVTAPGVVRVGDSVVITSR